MSSMEQDDNEGGRNPDTKNDHPMAEMVKAMDAASLMVVGEEDQLPHVILRGSMANLSPLRGIQAVDFFAQRDTSLLVDKPLSCRMRWEEDDNEEGDDDFVVANDGDDVENDIVNKGAEAGSEEIADKSRTRDVRGQVYVTSSQVIFVASDNSHQDSSTGATQNPDVLQISDDDWAIGATCIHLHAVTEDPELAIYLQLESQFASDTGSDGPTEVTIIPQEPDECQVLFDALCRLVSLHPLELDEDDGNYGGGDNPMFGGSGDDDNDGLVWAPGPDYFNSVAVEGNEYEYDDDDDEEGGATTEQRDAMLERLDNLLEVRPEFEIKDGQFEDAEE